jgi:AcrR family transcriptional regulator
MARPRAFDEGEVLDHAMDVFWRLGYDGASMNELTRAMGVNSPSLYIAFGSKRGLFDAVLDRYEARRAPHRAWMLEGETALEVATRMLFGSIEWLTAADEPRGCLLFQAGLAAGTTNTEVPRILADRRKPAEDALTKRFKRSVTEGDLPSSSNPRQLSRYLITVFSGLAVQAAAGASAEELKESATLALAAWPD